MKTGHDPLAIAIADALLHERAQRRMAAEDALIDQPRIVAQQLAVEAQPKDAAAVAMPSSED